MRLDGALAAEPSTDQAASADLRSALAAIESDVRTRIRQNGVDPVTEPQMVARLVTEAVERHLALVGAGQLDQERLREQVVDAVAGFGPLQRYLSDPTVEEIWINEPGRVFVARRGRSQLTTTELTAGQVRDLVERMLLSSGRRIDLSSPFVDARLADGSRLHVAIPDATRAHWAVNIRKFVAPATDLDDLVGLGVLPRQAARFLDAAVRSGITVVVSGPTHAGKTTLLSCLLASVPDSERVISCEEVFEVRVPGPDWVALQTRPASLEGTGEITLRQLVVEALRMRPNRLVVGEVRQAEALDLLIAFNSGIAGFCTVHANSARDAVAKLCTLPLLAGANIAHGFVVPTVASCIDLIVQTGVLPNGARRVREIVALPGRVEGGVVELADLFTMRAGELTRADGFPPHRERFLHAGFDLAELLRADPR